jgi:hypothetical protein
VTGTEPTVVGTTVFPRNDPPGPQRWRSAPAAALLNLTGLGLGYLYLGHRWRAVVTAAVTVVLVVVAFATDAASTPLLWRVLTAAVLAGAGVDGWRLARTGWRGPEAPPVPDRAGRIRPVAVALAAVVAVVAAYLGYGAVGRDVYADALSAQARGDCPTATRGFDNLTGPFELTLSRDVRVAQALRAECGVFLGVAQAEEQRRYSDAVAGYRDFRVAHPRSVLVPFASDHLRRTYDAWAAELRRDRRFDRSIGVYRDLLAEVGRGPGGPQVRVDLAATYAERAADTRVRVAAASGAPPVNLVGSAVGDLLLVAQEFPETPTATTVPQELAATYTAATGALGQQRYCDALPVLEYFAGLRAAEAGDLARTANADRPRALLECGLDHFRAGRNDDAIEPLTELATAYPDAPGTPQARSAVIAARVADETGRTVPLPAPLGDDSPGSVPVVYYNDSPYEVTVRVAGATAHEFVIPACTGCPIYGPLEKPSCKWGSRSPSHTLFLKPGEYVRAASSTSGGSFDGDDGADPTRTLESGYRYWGCYYVTSRLGGIRAI